MAHQHRPHKRRRRRNDDSSDDDLRSDSDDERFFFAPETTNVISKLCMHIIIMVVIACLLDCEYTNMTRLDPPLIPGHRLDFQNLDGMQAEYLFRFGVEDLQRLIVHLRFPLVMRTSQRDRYLSIEGLCIVLRRLVYPIRYVDMVHLFGRSREAMSRIHRHTMAWIHNRWSHLAEFDPDRVSVCVIFKSMYTWILLNAFINVLFVCAHACYRWHIDLSICACVFLIQMAHRFEEWSSDVRNVVPDTFRHVCLFIDGTVRQTCRPCPHPSRRPDGVTQYEIQRAQYSNHKHYHGFKAHAVIAPNGMVVHYFGPVDGRRHDSYLLHESGVFNRLTGLTRHGIDYQMYGDSAYPMHRNLLSPIPRIHAPTGSIGAELNRRMSVVRTCTSEWWYQITTNTFQALDFPRWQRMWLTVPALQYSVGMILVNCRTCLQGGNRITHFFNSQPTDII